MTTDVEAAGGMIGMMENEQQQQQQQQQDPQQEYHDHNNNNNSSNNKTNASSFTTPVAVRTTTPAAVVAAADAISTEEPREEEEDTTKTATTTSVATPTTTTGMTTTTVSSTPNKADLHCHEESSLEETNTTSMILQTPDRQANSNRRKTSINSSNNSADNNKNNNKNKRKRRSTPTSPPDSLAFATEQETEDLDAFVRLNFEGSHVQFFDAMVNAMKHYRMNFSLVMERFLVHDEKCQRMMRNIYGKIMGKTSSARGIPPEWNDKVMAYLRTKNEQKDVVKQQDKNNSVATASRKNSHEEEEDESKVAPGTTDPSPTTNGKTCPSPKEKSLPCTTTEAIDDSKISSGSPSLDMSGMQNKQLDTDKERETKNPAATNSTGTVKKKLMGRKGVLDTFITKKFEGNYISFLKYLDNERGEPNFDAEDFAEYCGSRKGTNQIQLIVSTLQQGKPAGQLSKKWEGLIDDYRKTKASESTTCAYGESKEGMVAANLMDQHEEQQADNKTTDEKRKRSDAKVLLKSLGPDARPVQHTGIPRLEAVADPFGTVPSTTAIENSTSSIATTTTRHRSHGVAPDSSSADEPVDETIPTAVVRESDMNSVIDGLDAAQTKAPVPAIGRETQANVRGGIGKEATRPRGRPLNTDVVHESQAVDERPSEKLVRTKRQHTRKRPITDGEDPSMAASPKAPKQLVTKPTQEGSHPDQTLLEPNAFTENDVLCGRGAGRKTHRGNVTFRSFIHEHQPRFLNASKSDRHGIAIEVVRLWREMIPPGRFLTQHKDDKWFDIGEDAAVLKVTKALSETRYGVTKSPGAKSIEPTKPIKPKKALARELAVDMVLPPPLNSRKRTRNPVVANQLSTEVSKDDALKNGRKKKRLKSGTSRNACGTFPEGPKKQDRTAETTHRIQKLREESKLLQKSLPPSDPYAEEIAFLHHNPVVSFKDLHPLPQAEPLPDIPKHSSGWASWQDEQQRIFLADFSGIQEISEQSKEFLSQMMQRDDITVITQGIMHGFRQELWSQAAVNQACGNRWYHKFRHFRWDPVKESYVEQNGYLSMKVGDFCKYLCQRDCFLNHKNDHDKVFRFVNGQTPQQEIELDVENDVIYMLDLDMTKLLPQTYQDFVDNFKIKEMLPGGEWCMMNKVRRLLQQKIVQSISIGITIIVFFRWIVGCSGGGRLLHLAASVLIWFLNRVDVSCTIRIDRAGALSFPPIVLTVRIFELCSAAFMGPNLYMTPAGSFTHLHQDGHGTVDSGHYNVTGYNEVIMLRRMPEIHKRNACQMVPGASAKYDALYGKPHDSGMGIVVRTGKR
eukprot:scaffold14974_cov195-Amphora_coffeaeformis.AAC.65